MQHPINTRPLLALAAGVTVALALAGCSADAVKQATSLGSSVASDVASGVKGLTGDAVQQGMSSVAGGIDGALSSALKGANITSDGKIPSGFPTQQVPLVDGTVLGGGAGPNGIGWVVQLRVSGVGVFSQAGEALTSSGFTNITKRSDDSSAFGMYRNSAYRVILVISKGTDNTTATYIVTKR